MEKKKTHKVRNVLLTVLAVNILLAGGIYLFRKPIIHALVNSQWLMDRSIRSLKGNAEQYHPENVEPLPDSPLKGKTVIFLGSSVTQGTCSLDVSFVEYLEKRDGIIPVKEAVSGTTLVTGGEMADQGYIPRMEKLDKSIQADAFVCQLSTNDAGNGKPLGEITDSFDRDNFDTETVAGAIEYIISYARETWNCPILFYTSPKFNSDTYGDTVTLLLKIANKWDVSVLDMWNDAEFNNISKEDYKLYMPHEIHPSQAGYLVWWTPKFEQALTECMQK